MMEPFTGIDNGIIPTAAAMASSANPTTTPASVPNENAGITATITTPLSSPQKRSSPSTPDQTPLRQRFLRAVSMSPAIPSRPSMGGRKTSEKARGSPIVVRHTPKKTNQPPMKLEVGQGAFYFSIELPPSKITRKKSGATSKSGTPKGGETPTRTRTPSPLKNGSPTKEDAAGTPTKTTPSPLKRRETIHQISARPLFGTPTRTTTPKQNTDPQTPTRRTPSPRKTLSAVNQSPTRISVETPRRKALGDTSGSNRSGSPVKRSMEQDASPADPIKTFSLLANKVRAESKHTSRKQVAGVVNLEDGHVPNADLVATAFTSPPPPHSESTGQAPTAKTSPENIGQLMASLISNSTSTHDWASSHHNNDTISPVPTPLRKAGEKLKLGESPSFLRMSANGTTTVTSEDPVADIIKIGLLVRHEPASTEPRPDRSRPIRSSLSGLMAAEAPSPIAEGQVTKLDHAEDMSQEPRRAFPLHQGNLEPMSTLDIMRKVPAPPRLPLSFPKQRSETTQRELSQKEHQASRQEMERALPKSFLPVPANQPRRVGTDPSVLLKMQKDMVSLEPTMRHSAGVIDPDFCGPLYLNELPEMPNGLFVRNQQDVRSPGAADTPQALSRATSDDSRESVQANGEKDIGAPMAAARVSSAPRIPRWKPGGTTPALVKEDRLAAAKRRDSQSQVADKTVALGRARPRAESVVSRPNKSGLVTSTLRRKTLATPIKPTVSLEATNRSSPHSRIPSLTSADTKSTTPPVPKIIRKPLPGTSGPGKAVAALKDRLPNVPSAPINPRPVPTRKPLRPSAIEPYNPLADPRPYEQKFASAGDIADRLAGWHNEDRKKAQADCLTVPTRPANKTPVKPPAKSQANESTTPDGSPTQTLTLPMVSAATNSARPFSPTKDTRSTTFSAKPPPPTTPKSKPRASAPAPKTPVPKTPALGPRKAAVNDLRKPITTGAAAGAASKTPVSRRVPVLDRNATRTPSKAIVSSLDAAIDRKIAEDARRGLEFTPSGNRLRDLLDAKSVKIDE